MGDLTEDVPKAFLEVEGRTLYDRQRAALSAFVDGVTVVLGYEAETACEHLSSIETSRGYSQSADTVVLNDWNEFDNAESLRRALITIDGDALVLNGDVMVAPETVRQLAQHFHEAGRGHNVVGCLPGVQNDNTAIQCDSSGEVTAYGKIAGNRHAGVGIIDSRNRDDAIEVLSRNADDWYPHVYPETPTERVVVSPDTHLEINRPADLDRTHDRLPLVDTEESRSGVRRTSVPSGNETENI